MGRPNQKKAARIFTRNNDIWKMRKYPYDYLAAYFGLSIGQISKIIKQLIKNKGRQKIKNNGRQK